MEETTISGAHSRAGLGCGERIGGSAGARTRDLSIKSRLLYRLSYGPDRRRSYGRGGVGSTSPPAAGPFACRKFATWVQFAAADRARNDVATTIYAESGAPDPASVHPTITRCPGRARVRPSGGPACVRRRVRSSSTGRAAPAAPKGSRSRSRHWRTAARMVLAGRLSECLIVQLGEAVRWRRARRPRALRSVHGGDCRPARSHRYGSPGACGLDIEFAQALGDRPWLAVANGLPVDPDHRNDEV